MLRERIRGDGEFQQGHKKVRYTTDKASRRMGSTTVCSMDRTCTELARTSRPSVARRCSTQDCQKRQCTRKECLAPNSAHESHGHAPLKEAESRPVQQRSSSRNPKYLEITKIRYDKDNDDNDQNDDDGHTPPKKNGRETDVANADLHGPKRFSHHGNEPHAFGGATGRRANMKT